MGEPEQSTPLVWQKGIIMAYGQYPQGYRPGMQGAPQKPRKKRRLIKLMALLLAIFVGIPAGILGVVKFKASRTELPPLKTGVSTVLTADGKVLGKIQTTESAKVELTSKQIPNLVRHTILAAEDREFYRHGAISITGIALAGITNIRTGSLAGGSTVTQQYVKNAYLSHDQTARRKWNELNLAYQLEHTHPGRQGKDEIFTKYGNIIFLGRGVGIEGGAYGYYGHSAAKLNDYNNPDEVAKAATLAAIIKNPCHYGECNDGDPETPDALTPERRQKLLERRNLVIDGMSEVVDSKEIEESKTRFPKLSPEVIAAAKTKPISFKKEWRSPVKKSDETDPFLTDMMRRWLISYMQTQLKNDPDLDISDKEAESLGRSEANALLARGGITFETTINSKYQQVLTEAKRHLDDPKLQMAAVVTDPRTGGILAMVGGVRYGLDKSKGQSQFNNAVEGNRPLASTGKIGVLALAVKNGWSPKSALPVAAYHPTGDGGKISNHPERPQGVIDWYQAMAQSTNTYHAGLINCEMPRTPQTPEDIVAIPGCDKNKMNPQAVIDLENAMGLADNPYPGKPKPSKQAAVTSVAIGSNTASTTGLAALASTLANDGKYRKQFIVKRARFASDLEDYVYEPADAKEILTENQAATINQVLRGPVESGTAKGAIPRTGSQIAGKTGTEYDGRFVGWTPAFACSAWMGIQDKLTEPDEDLWGSDAARVCGDFFDAALNGDKNRGIKAQPKMKFPKPDLNEFKLLGVAPAPPAPASPSAQPPPSETAPPSPTISPEPSGTVDPSASPSESVSATPTESLSSSPVADDESRRRDRQTKSPRPERGQTLEVEIPAY